MCMHLPQERYFESNTTKINQKPEYAVGTQCVMAVTDNDKMPSGKSIVSTDKFVGAGIEVIDIHAV